ncbi:glycosyl transferase family 2 [Sulfodiicoccus acidiphilus]|uniref:Glycosyl transferase family 2 n=2 Tax=Sulfodiicoccus acidiphilus TaxID=1670455 RepID=A0A348B484_9CREN|nr:glycosyl transferase family 2 [Sulfodiicoccus acidiphilus]GGT87545.1 glycosyl transferase family 2 [Sulfodiicoccus acidiphilus]
MDALLNQDYDRSKYEVLVVESGSTDGTLNVCRKYEMNYDNVKCFHIQRKALNGKSEALNFAIKLSKGDVIGVFDADTMPRLDVLSYAAAKFKDPKVAGVQGRLLPFNVRDTVLARFASLEELLSEYALGGRARLGAFVSLEGTCMFIRRSVLEELGGWREDVLTEDFELSLRALSAGYTVVYSPSVLARREVVVRLRSLLKQRLRWYRGRLEVDITLLRMRRDVRAVDALLTIATPVVMIMYASTYFLPLVASLHVLQEASVAAGTSTVFTFLVTMMISRRHLIEPFYGLLSYLYVNLVIALNVAAVFLEVTRRRKVWVKTERAYQQKLNPGR